MKTEKPQAFLIDIISKYKKGSQTTQQQKANIITRTRDTKPQYKP